MLLRIAFAANILILVPVAFATIASVQGADRVFESKFEIDSPLRVLVGCLWMAILVCSVIGLIWPRMMVGILMLQVLYKALFLGLVIFPLWKEKGIEAVPMGVSVCFALIVALWPFVLWRTYPWRLCRCDLAGSSGSREPVAERS